MRRSDDDAMVGGVQVSLPACFCTPSPFRRHGHSFVELKERASEGAQDGLYEHERRRLIRMQL